MCVCIWVLVQMRRAQSEPRAMGVTTMRAANPRAQCSDASGTGGGAGTPRPAGNAMQCNAMQHNGPVGERVCACAWVCVYVPGCVCK